MPQLLSDPEDRIWSAIAGSVDIKSLKSARREQPKIVSVMCFAPHPGMVGAENHMTRWAALRGFDAIRGTRVSDSKPLGNLKVLMDNRHFRPEHGDR